MPERDPEVSETSSAHHEAPYAAEFEAEYEMGAERALARTRVIPERRLLSFYDRLRDRILAAVERKGGKLSSGTVKALLLVPDVFILLVRLSLDKDVPSGTRALIGGTLAYFVLPIDLLPEMLVGGVGFLDDLVLASAVLSQAFSGELEPYARKHWSGTEDLRVVLGDITKAGRSLLGGNLYDRVRKVLGRRGIRIEE